MFKNQMRAGLASTLPRFLVPLNSQSGVAGRAINGGASYSRSDGRESAQGAKEIFQIQQAHDLNLKSGENISK